MLVGEALEISLKDAELWRTKTRAERCLDIEFIRRNLDLAKHLAGSNARCEGLGQLLPHVDEIAAGEIPQTSELNMTARAVLPTLVDLVKQPDLKMLGK